MKRLFLSLLIGAGLIPLAAHAETMDTWTNGVSINLSAALPIDATNFINSGTISVSSVFPFDTSNTRNFTNSGTMQGAVGFQFDYAPRNSGGALTAPRQLAANFHNRNGGLVTAFDSTLFNGNLGSYLLVYATNIVNQGNLSVGAGGLLHLVGSNVNLSFSGTGVRVITPQGSFNDSPTTNVFSPDVAIYDNYWGQTNMNITTDFIIRPDGSVQSPPHRVTQGAGFFTTVVGVGNPYSSGYSNAVGIASFEITLPDGSTMTTNVVTNFVRQAVFVGVNNPSNTTVNIFFSPSSEPTNFFRTAHVLIATDTTNVVSAGLDANTVYFQDTLASETNSGVLANFSGGGSRPANYLLSRIQQGGGIIGNVPITPDFLYETSFSNRVVNGPYAGYSAFIDNLVSRPPATPGGTVTNMPGRIKIQANSLDMLNARVRGSGYVEIDTKHLVRSAGAVVDCENVSFFLGSTNGPLRVQNLMKESVERVRGDVYAWSGTWSNSYVMEIENYEIDEETGEATPAPLTNSVTVGLHVLILDGSSLFDELPVAIHKFETRGTNVVISANDNGTVIETFFVDGQSFTLQGNLSLDGNLFHWVHTNAPNLQYFTNTGVLSIPGEAHFGDDGAAPYLAYVNAGRIQSGSLVIKSDYCEIAGTNAVNGPATIITPSAKFEGGRVTAGGDITLQGNVFKLNRAGLVSNRRLNLVVTGSIFDSGGGSSNSIVCLDGFHMQFKPASGDLLGTSVSSVAPSFARVEHFWAAEDRLATRDGFSDNVALGRLTLTPGGFAPYAYAFAGTGPGKALYVDWLDLSQLSDYQNQLEIDPSLVIYFAAATVAPTVTLPVNHTAEEFLDGQFEGRLRWVKDFAGPNSSVDVLVNGTQTIQVNRARRNSKLLDDDGDGVPNFFDFTPFDGVVLASIEPVATPAGVKISWMAAAGTVYHVEYQTNFNAPWQKLLTTTYIAATNGICSVIDTNGTTGAGMRLYRVMYRPAGQ
ncbi:MAG: hypothetical protein KIS67_28420 [Verrucomicrobiae bacterium]|nr:hypothetical protein [Verrucomicrobiae bacterium]